jgi:hypothetical protein
MRSHKGRGWDSRSIPRETEKAHTIALKRERREEGDR